MKTQTLYMNVYRAGFYHRQGKPGHCNIHAGDFFTSRVDAEAHVEPDKGYITTVSFEMPLPDGTTILANPEGSVPTPLHETRGNPLALMPWHSSPQVFPVAILSAGQCAFGACQPDMEPVDDPIGMTYEEWAAERQRTGFAPLPAPTPQRKVPALLRAYEEAA